LLKHCGLDSLFWFTAPALHWTNYSGEINHKLAKATTTICRKMQLWFQSDSTTAHLHQGN